MLYLKEKSMETLRRQQLDLYGNNKEHFRNEGFHPII